jgi:hypothetical protein
VRPEALPGAARVATRPSSRDADGSRAPRRAPETGLRARRLADLALAGVVAVAAAAALEQVVYHRSLWPDEALVAANVVHRGFLGLLRPLAFQQGAPVGWLWAERAAVELFGNNGYALVALPLVSGLACYLLVAIVARRVCSPLAAVAATAVVAWSPDLLFHATEVKQYATDAAATLGIVLGTLAVLGVGQALPPRNPRERGGEGRATPVSRRDAGPSLRRRPLLVLGLFCALAIWLSHAAVLASVAAGAALVGVAAVRRRPGDVGFVVAAFLPAAASAVADYLLFLRPLAHDRYLLGYWKAGFPSKPLAPASFVRFLVHAGSGLFADPGRFGMPVLAGVLFVVGAAVLVRRAPAGALGAFAVLPVAVLASALHGYPLEGRLSLYLVPLLGLGMAAALDLARVARRPRGAHVEGAGGRPRIGRAALGGAALVALGATAASPVAQFFGDVAHPIVVSETRPLFRYVAAHERPGDVVVLDPGASDAYQYYATTTGLRAGFVVLPVPSGGTCTDPSALVPPGARRVWLIFGYRLSAFPGDWQRLVVGEFAPSLETQERVVAPKAAAYLLVPRGPSEPEAPGPPSSAGAPSGGAPTRLCLALEPLLPVPPTGLRADPFGTGPLT